MTNEKILEVVSIYEKELNGISLERADSAILNTNRAIAMRHCVFMLNQIRTFINAGRTTKAYRWLGFVQGVMWSHGKYSIDQLANQNREEHEASTK